MQRAWQIIYPPQCISCNALMGEEHALCGDCWRETSFITGLVCEACGTPLPGEADTVEALCDDCMTIARPWDKGRAAVLYKGNARRLVLALKHGDRLELAKPMARWLVSSVRPILRPNMVVVPVPAHRSRLFRRRYNQAALIANELAKIAALTVLPDALVRLRPTIVQDGMGRDARFRNMSDAITPHPKRGAQLDGRAVLLVDDVMTSGATLAAATEACHAAGASSVCVSALARVAKDT